jgi:hypothetical protein
MKALRSAARQAAGQRAWSIGRARTGEDTMIRTSIAALFLLAASPAIGAEPELARHGTFYVPLYSNIYHGNLDGRGKPASLLLSAMLSIRNTDLDHGITVQSVRFYDSDGKLVKDYYAQPKRLGPLGSTEIFVENKDSTGGPGAKFIVVWDAESPVNLPIMDTVNAYVFGTQTTIFTAAGRPISAAKK